jgi:hypothetical protein
MTLGAQQPARPTRRTVLTAGAGLAAIATLGTSPAFAKGAAAHQHKADLGASLYDAVLSWSRWPLHRTGTTGEEHSLKWLERELRRRGASTSHWHYDYPHYDWNASVRVGRRRVPTVPLYYEGVGRWSGRPEFVRSVTTSKDGSDPAVLAALAEASDAGAPFALLATTSTTATYAPYDGLVGYNSDPDVAKTGIPTLLVPGRDAGRIAQYGAHVDFSARTVSARAYNLTGWLGTPKPVADPIIVTTPLSGWFTTAAERGTGIALALELASELAKDHPVFFLGNTGHELNNYGARAYFAQEFDLQPLAVFHLGASLAAAAKDADGRFALAPRGAASNPPIDQVPGLAADLATARFSKAAKFPGEGAVWNELLGPSVPLLSIAGNFREFHSPDDVPEETTSPEVLLQAYNGVRAAAGDLLDLA